MAPEVSNECYTMKADLYSLGAILKETISGKTFDPENPNVS